MKLRFLVLIVLLVTTFAPRPAAGVFNPQPAARSRQPESPPSTLTVAVLDFGEAEAGRRAADRVARLFAEAGAAGAYKLSVIDRDLARAASRGAGYRGSLNLTLREARDLGAAVGCDFVVTGDAQTLRRSPSDRAPFQEAYASVFVFSARTGRLVLWERPAAEAATPERAEAALFDALDARAAGRYLAAAAEAHAREERERTAPRVETRRGAPLLDLSDEEGERGEVREPAPFRRPRPVYTEAAARAEAEATVDALVEVDEQGRVARVEVVRWAGFGLDESVADAVRSMRFRPATLDGEAVASRVLLRYNFRRPSAEKKEESNR